MHSNYKIVFFSLAVLFFIQAKASVYEVTPTQLTLSSKQIVGIAKLTNRSHETGLLQLSLLDWQQSYGKDVYQISHDILLTPPIFKLPPGKTQLIRFALRHPVFLAEQKTYRLHIKEVEQPRQKKLGQALYFIMDISLPLFVQPEHMVERFVWSAKSIDTKHLKLRLYNDGNISLFVSQWQLLARETAPIKQSTFAYVLPHQSHNWIVSAKTSMAFTDINATINGKNKKSVLHRL